MGRGFAAILDNSESDWLGLKTGAAAAATCDSLRPGWPGWGATWVSSLTRAMNAEMVI
jgi:hypothetical protein